MTTSSRTWLGWFGAALTLMLALSLETALPVVIDLRRWLLATGVGGGVLLLLACRRASSRTRGMVRRGGSVICLAASALAAFDVTFAYRTEDVSFTSGDAAIEGTLYLPRGRGPFPALVLMHGSGTQPRDEYRFYARLYARHGVAALAYDKRGSGASTGTIRSTYQMFAADAAKAIEFLRLRPDIDGSRVGIWALSEGEWTGPLAASQADAAFLVVISASAMTPAEQVAYETGARVRRAGFGEVEANEAADLYRGVSQFQRTGEGGLSLNAALQTASAQPWFAAAWYLEPSVPEFERVRALEWYPAWRERMDFDALPILSTLKCPILLLNGGADPKNDGALANERIRLALERGGNTRFTGVIYEKAGHNVIEWRLPFGLPPPLFAEGYLQRQLDWVVELVGE